eukprot:TRINITY_DN926_c0_g2_i3.p1 TRINITY_DN926_c0_g2~~TRINITY_DN926_c0_g2_i3.p1  ORF type:complete len:431 (-),score=106.78 TRINITY_DN926_c0_g2_i3:979-2151(-)
MSEESLASRVSDLEKVTSYLLSEVRALKLSQSSFSSSYASSPPHGMSSSHHTARTGSESMREDTYRTPQASHTPHSSLSASTYSYATSTVGKGKSSPSVTRSPVAPLSVADLEQVIGAKPSAPESVSVDQVFAAHDASLRHIFTYYLFYLDGTRGISKLDRRCLQKLIRDAGIGSLLRAESSLDLILVKILQLPRHSPVKKTTALGFDEFKVFLVVVADGLLSDVYPSWTPAQKLATILEKCILPLERRSRTPEKCEELEDPEARSLLSKSTKELKKIFKFYACRFATSRQTRGVSFPLHGFLEFLRHHGLRSLLPSRNARDIFLHVASAEQSFTKEITFPQFLTTLCYISNAIYGQDIYEYTSPEKRMDKLLMKILVLSDPVDTDLRGN